MANGLSLHIGINKYSKFNGIPELTASHESARAMFRFAHELGYRPLDAHVPMDGRDPSNVLVEDSATLTKVSEWIRVAAEKLHNGDAFLLTFAGHGTQVFDSQLKEPDKRNEVSVLADEYLIDDMLYCLLSHFERGVRIFFVSDACHSGTSIGPPPLTPFAAQRYAPMFDEGTVMALPERVSIEIWRERRDKYFAMVGAECAENTQIEAFAVQFAACSDNQYTVDGRFTRKFLGRWKKGFAQGCREFASAVDAEPTYSSKSTPQCTPVRSTLIKEPDLEAFLAKTPFIL